MKNLYEIYLEKKAENDKKMYLFKAGNFYYFLGEDAKTASEELMLKLTKFSSKSDKCGFPISSFERYSKFLNVLKLDFEVVLSKSDQIILDIKDLDLDKITGIKAVEKLKEYQKILGE